MKRLNSWKNSERLYSICFFQIESPYSLKNDRIYVKLLIEGLKITLDFNMIGGK